MDRHNLVTETRDYFHGSDHWRRLVAHLQEPDPHNAHVHGYVNTSIHPDSLEKILRDYFAQRGWPLVRPINRVSARPGILDLHGIEPKGKVHFELLWTYKADVGIRPADGVESGSNLLLWNRVYIEDFYRSYRFRNVGPQAEEALSIYFESEHWLEGLEIAAQPNVPHMHINGETSLHPDEIGRRALRALGTKGWEVDYLCPNAFLLRDRYIGKIVFMGKKPKKVYDIGWKFNPDTIIKPTDHPWMFPDRVGYDVMTSEQFEAELGRHSYVKLTNEEVAAVVG